MEAERARLAARIQQWNESCVDLFWMSSPDEALEFDAVVRFQVQAEGSAGRVRSTCVRVASRGTVVDVLCALQEKLQTSLNSYGIFEALPNKGERRLGSDERPLLVQLGWNPKGHHGSFILKPTSSPPAKVESCESPSIQATDNDQDSLQSLKSSSGRAIQQLRRSFSGGSHQRERRKSWGEKATSPVMRQGSQGPRSSTLPLGSPQQLQEGDCEGGDVEGDEQCLPCLVDVTPGGSQRIYFLHCEETAIGCEPDQHRSIQVHGPGVGGRHCLVHKRDGVVTLVPCAPLSNLTYVDNQPVHDPVMLHSGDTVCLGSSTLLQFVHGPHSILEEEMMGNGNADFMPSGPAVAGLERGELGLRRPSVETKADVHRAHGQPLLPEGQRQRAVRFGHSQTRQAVGAFMETGPTAVGHGHCFSESALSAMAPGASQPEPRLRDPSMGSHLNQPTGRLDKAGTPTRTVDQGDHRGNPPLEPKHSKVKLRNALTSELYQKQAAFEAMSMEQGNKEKPFAATSEGTLQRLHAYELCLPVYVEVTANAEEEFLDAVISPPSDIPPSFGLGPAYTIYSACRFLLSSQGSCPLPASQQQQQQWQRHQQIVQLTEGAASLIESTVEASRRDMMLSGFWMANASELLHLLEQDGDLRPATLSAQEILSSAVHTAFSNLVECLKTELSVRLPVFLQDPQTLSAGAPQIGPVLSLLTEAMLMLRAFKTNPALLVQIFARVFTLITGWLFNSLLSDVDLGLRSRYWATTLQRRLLPLARWAEGQGLERAAACHLAHIVQATELLTMRKYDVSDVREILVTCYRLNSLQMRALLETYQYAPDEPKIPQEVIEQVVSVTRDTTDAVWLSQQQEVSLLESLELRLPFLVPGDGYACESLTDIPAGLDHFLQPLLLAGLCKLLPQPWKGTWTVFFSGDTDRHSATSSLSEVSVVTGEPEIVRIDLQKRQGLGFSIVAAKGPRQANIGIYIKSIIKGGAADSDGRLTKGDQLLSINGTSLMGISEKQAVEIMMKTESVVALDVAKNAALFHNLADTLSQPTPLSNRVVRRTSRASRPKSESFTTEARQERDHSLGSAAHSQVDVLRLLEVEIDRLNSRHRSPLEEEQLQNLRIEYQSQLGSQHVAPPSLPHHHNPPTTVPHRSSAFKPAASMLELSTNTLVTQRQQSHPSLQGRLGQALPASSVHSLGTWEQRRHPANRNHTEAVHLGTSQPLQKLPSHPNTKQRTSLSSPLSFMTSAGAPPVGSRERMIQMSPTSEPSTPLRSTMPGIHLNMRHDGGQQNPSASVSQYTVPPLQTLQSPGYNPPQSGLHLGGFNASVKHRRETERSRVEPRVEMEAAIGSVSYAEPPASYYPPQATSDLSPDLDPDLGAGGFRPLLFRAPVPQEAERSSPVLASRFPTGFSLASDGKLNKVLQESLFEPILNFSKNMDQTLTAVQHGLCATQTNPDGFKAKPYDVASTIPLVKNGSEHPPAPIPSDVLSPHKPMTSPHETELLNEFGSDCGDSAGESQMESPSCQPWQQQQQPHELTESRPHLSGVPAAESKFTRRTSCRVIPDVLSSISEEMWPENAHQSIATEQHVPTQITHPEEIASAVTDTILQPTNDQRIVDESSKYLARYDKQGCRDEVEVNHNKHGHREIRSDSKESELASSAMHMFAAEGIGKLSVERVETNVQVPGGKKEPSRLLLHWNETKASATPEASPATESKLPVFSSHRTHSASLKTTQRSTAGIADDLKSEDVIDRRMSLSDVHRKPRSHGLPRVTTETLTLALRETEECWEARPKGPVISQLPSAIVPFASPTLQLEAPAEHSQCRQSRISPGPASTGPKVEESVEGNVDISRSVVNSHFQTATKDKGLTHFNAGPTIPVIGHTSSYIEPFSRENFPAASDKVESQQSSPKAELTPSSGDLDSHWNFSLMQNNGSPSGNYLDEAHRTVEVMSCSDIEQFPEFSPHIKQVKFRSSTEAMETRRALQRDIVEKPNQPPKEPAVTVALEHCPRDVVVHGQEEWIKEPSKNNHSALHSPQISTETILVSSELLVLPERRLCSDIENAKTTTDITLRAKINPVASPEKGDDTPDNFPKVSKAFANKSEETSDDQVLNNFQLSPVDQTIDTRWENLIHSQLDRYLESPLLEATSSSSSEIPAMSSKELPLRPPSLPLPLEAEMLTDMDFPPPPSPSTLQIDDSPWVERTAELRLDNEYVRGNGAHADQNPDEDACSRVTAQAIHTYSSAPQDQRETSWAFGRVSVRDVQPMRVVDVREGTARTDVQVLDNRDSFRAQRISGLRLNPSKSSWQRGPRPAVSAKPKSLTSPPQQTVQPSARFMRSGVYKPHPLRQQNSNPGGSAHRMPSAGLREPGMGDKHQDSRDTHLQHSPFPSDSDGDAPPDVELLPFNERLSLFRRRESQRKHT